MPNLHERSSVLDLTPESRSLLTPLHSSASKADVAISNTLSKFAGGATPGAEEPAEGIIKTLWGYFVFALIGWFALSCVEQLAQAKAAEIDEKDIETELIRRKDEMTLRRKRE